MAVSSSASLASKPPLPALCRIWYLHLQVYLPVAKSPIAFKPPLYSYLGCVVFHWQDQEVVELVHLKSTLLVQAVKVQKALSELKTPSGSLIQPVEDPTQRAKQQEVENLELTPFHIASQEWSWI